MERRGADAGNLRSGAERRLKFDGSPTSGCDARQVSLLPLNLRGSNETCLASKPKSANYWKSPLHVGTAGHQPPSLFVTRPPSKILIVTDEDVRLMIRAQQDELETCEWFEQAQNQCPCERSSSFLKINFNRFGYCSCCDWGRIYYFIKGYHPGSDILEAAMLGLCFWGSLGFVARYAVYSVRSVPGSVESSIISTPANSWTRMKEGHFLWSHDINPYDGDLVHGSPVALYLSSFLIRVLGSDTLIAGFFCLVDVLVAIILRAAVARAIKNMADDEEARHSSLRPDAPPSMLLKNHDAKSIAFNVMKLYLFCPYTVLNAADVTLTVFSNLLLACVFYCVAHGHYLASAMCLALAAYEDLYPVVLVPAAAYVAWKGLYSDVQPEQTSRLGFFAVCFVASLSLLLHFSAILMDGSWSFLRAKYGFLWNVPDLTPNIGLFWYFFTEMFEHFRIFFICSFQINAFIYAVPLLIKFHKEPMMVIYSLLSLMAIFKSYPSIGDVGFYLSLLPMWSHLASGMRQFLVTFCFFVATMALAPVLWHLWLYDGSANANFFFGITLVFAAAQILLLSDIIFAFMRRDYEIVHGRWKPGDKKPRLLALQ